MTKFIVNNMTDAWKTDVNCFFTITNCQIVRSHRINYKFICLSTYWQWKLANERARISAVIVKEIKSKSLRGWSQENKIFKTMSNDLCAISNFGHVRSNLQSQVWSRHVGVPLAYGCHAWNLKWLIRIQQAGKTLLSPLLCWIQYKLTGKALKSGNFYHWKPHQIFTKRNL